MGCGSSSPEDPAPSQPHKSVASSPKAGPPAAPAPAPAKSPSVPSSPGAASVGKDGKPGARRRTAAAGAQRRKIRDVYKIGKTLGTGGFSVVKLGVDKVTSEEFAIKIMGLPGDGAGEAGQSENSREDIFREINIMLQLDHPSVVFLKEYYEEGNKVYLVTELLTGGELLDAVLQRGSYSEADARNCFRQLLEGIAYLHDNNIVHRDLKLENLLLVTPEDITKVKIADFGLAKKAAERLMSTVCGTPQYVAPEIITGMPGYTYTKNVDMWSAGVILFILLGGYPPFYDDNEPVLFEKIRQANYSFNDPVWANVSKEAKDFIKALLVTDPATRPTANAALKNKWFQSTAAGKLDGARERMAKTYRPNFRAAVDAVIAGIRMSNILGPSKSTGPQTAPAA